MAVRAFISVLSLPPSASVSLPLSSWLSFHSISDSVRFLAELALPLFEAKSLPHHREACSLTI